MAIDWNIIGIWIGAFYTIGFFTLAIGVNPWLRFVETTWLGAVVGFAFAMGVKNILSLGINPLMRGDVSVLVALALGALLFSRFINQYRHFSKWGVALMVGVGSGLGIRGAVDGMLLKQIEATFISPIVIGDVWQSINNIIIIVMVITTLSYFVFSFEFKKPSNILLKLGRWSMMIAFGAAYGNTVTFRFNLFIERFTFLIRTWLQLG